MPIAIYNHIVKIRNILIHGDAFYFEDDDADKEVCSYFLYEEVDAEFYTLDGMINRR